MLTLHFRPYALCRNVRHYIITGPDGTRLWTGSNKRKALRRIRYLLKKGTLC